MTTLTRIRLTLLALSAPSSWAGIGQLRGFVPPKSVSASISGIGSSQGPRSSSRISLNLPYSCPAAANERLAPPILSSSDPMPDGWTPRRKYSGTLTRSNVACASEWRRRCHRDRVSAPSSAYLHRIQNGLQRRAQRQRVAASTRPPTSSSWSACMTTATAIAMLRSMPPAASAAATAPSKTPSRPGGAGSSPAT